MLKLRFFVLGFAFALSLGLSALYLKNRNHPPVVERGPAASVPSIPESAKPNSYDGSVTCKSLYKTICQKRGETRDPTGYVQPDLDGEVQALRTYRDIIDGHRDWTSDQIDEELVKTIYTPKRRERIQAAFRWVEQAYDKLLARQPDSVFTPREKRQLRSRLRKVTLQIPPPASVYNDEPDLFTKNDVYYERMLDGQMRIRVGGAYVLSAHSWFNMIFTMAHEFAHAVDPCEIRSANLAFPAYDRITACFLQKGYVATRKTRSECGDNDQLSETFADWMAVHVTAEALKTFATEFHGAQLISAAANSVRDLCEQEDGVDLEFHPSPQLRIEKIFGLNPGVREVLGCLPVETPEYCSFLSPTPLLNQPITDSKSAAPQNAVRGIAGHRRNRRTNENH